MKTRFNTYDIMCMVTELQSLVDMRVNQVYDIDNKTYVIRLQRSEEKKILLIESGNRFHTTHFEWPKNSAPSGFTMKLRKHLKNKRLEKISQLGVDRIVDFQFGSGEAAYHIILELYDRGNIVLTDCEWCILNVLRPHVEGDKVRFAVREKYPLDRAKTNYKAPSGEELVEILSKSKPGDNLKKILNPNLEYGSAIIDHVLIDNGLSGNMKIAKEPGKGFYLENDLEKLIVALKQAEKLLDAAKINTAKGYITQKKEERPNPQGGESNYLMTNVEFHPMLYNQHKGQPIAEFETFDRAVDEFYSALEGQKIDLKTVQVEREAMKKLTNVRKDHEKRVTELEQVQMLDKKRAELISRNQLLVDQARLAIQTAIANQMSWDDVKHLVKLAQEEKDPIASCIKNLKLDINHITLLLTDPFTYADEDDDDDDNTDRDDGDERLEPMLVDIDLSLSAYANARRYYDQKRTAAKKQQKTLESADKALKSAERKTKQTLKEAHTISNIIKARKTYWFEKFYWFISSDNYLVIGGRDQQQNELLVKRYMRSSDIYVHAEVSGAASVIVKNPSGGPIPPKTLCEAGHMAVAYSVAWEAKVLTRAWWVHAHQVSKSAPTGEYLSTGSFMIRGKKNYLLTEHLQFGFTFLFRLEDSCIERHKDERKSIVVDDNASEVTSVLEEDQDIPVSDDDEQSDKEDRTVDAKLDTIAEEEAGNLEIKDVNLTEKGREQRVVDDDDDNDEGVGEDTREKEENNKNDMKSEEGSSSEDDFPDTHVKVDHETGKVHIESKTRTISEVSETNDNDVIPSFPSLPKLAGRSKRKPPKEQNKREDKKQEGTKRGQKGKLKKIKDKYKDQDDEERALIMEIMKISAQQNELKKSQKKKNLTKNAIKNKSGVKPVKSQPAAIILEASDEEPDAELETDQQGADADTEMLCQLTGSPFAEDELLFAVPVVAPYSALNNYKYRVKLTPGTSKRGKAAKTAVQVFLKDTSATPREKDLLKAVREENIARNFPGKVKLTAPQLHRHRK